MWPMNGTSELMENTDGNLGRWKMDGESNVWTPATFQEQVDYYNAQDKLTPTSTEPQATFADGISSLNQGALDRQQGLMGNLGAAFGDYMTQRMAPINSLMGFNQPAPDQSQAAPAPALPQPTNAATNLAQPQQQASMGNPAMQSLMDMATGSQPQSGGSGPGHSLSFGKLMSLM